MNIHVAFTAARCLLIMSVALWGAFGISQRSVAKSDFVVSKSAINMYSSPSADGDVVSQALYGTGVLSLEKKKKWTRTEWIKIRTGDGYTGWVMATGLTPIHGPYAPDGKAVRVVALSANVYREPNVTEHAPILNLPWEARLEMLPGTVDEGDRWRHVLLVDGQTAYVQQGDVSADFSVLTVDQTIQLARRFLGITYTWGGVSSYGYDCSGFTQMLVRQRGIIMPRDADVQAKWSGAVPVERNNLTPGDLLFFGESSDKITHTGMYIGDGEFIHDTTSKHPAVQISKLDDAPWTNLLVAARRVKQ